MSTNAKATGRVRRATTAHTDTTDADTPSADTPSADTTSADTAPHDPTSPDAGPVDDVGGDGPSTAVDLIDHTERAKGPDAGATQSGDEAAEPVTWADAVPWLALQVGSRPSATEVSIALPVWNLLHAAPGTTALRLAADAEVQGVKLDPAAVTRVLTRYQRAGIVTAIENGVTRWTPITPEAIIAAARHATTSATGTDPAMRRGRAVPGTTRPAGELRSAVAAQLAADPERDFSPAELSRMLDGGSSGAITNACERLVGDRVAERTSDRPRRYRHADIASTAPVAIPEDAIPDDGDGDADDR